MIFIILIQSLLMVSIKETGSQEILFDPLRRVSPCEQGLRSGTDRFTFTGTLGRNFNDLVNSNWLTFVLFYISVSSSPFTKICQMDVGPNGYFCHSLQTDICYCDHLNSTTGLAHFVFNYSAKLNHSKGTIKAQWHHQNGTMVDSARNVTLPAIYDVKRANLTIKVNGVPAKQVSTPLGVNFVPSQRNTVQLCCTNSASPCYPRMTFNAHIFESETGNCVSHTVFVPNVNYMANVTSSYSVCTKSDYITAGSGVIKTVMQSTTTVTTFKTTTSSTSVAPGTTEVTTVIPSTSSETAPVSPEPRKDDTVLIVSLSVIIPIALCICMVVAVSHFMKTPNRSQAVTNDGTNKTKAEERNKENQN